MLKEYRTLTPYLRGKIWFYVAGLLCLLATSGTQLAIPVFIKKAIDMIGSGNFLMSGIVEILLTMAGLAVVIALGRYGWRFFIHGASRRIESDLRQRMFDHASVLSRGYFEEQKIGDLMSRYTNDLGAVRMAASMALVAATDGIFMTVSILAIMIGNNPGLALITIVPLPFISVALIGMGRFVSHLTKRVQDGFGDLSQQVQESFSGSRVIKAFVREDLFLHRFRAVNEEYKQRNLKLVKLWGLFSPIVAFLSGITSLLLLRFGGEAVLTKSITTGDFVAALSYLQMLIWPMMGAGFTVNMIQRGAGALMRINEMLDRKPDIASPEVPVRRSLSGKAAAPAVLISGLNFSYGSTRVLEEIDLEVPAGSTLGIAGPTGSGKSTLISLMPRLVDAADTSIWIDGIAAKDWDLRELRARFGVVLQDTFLFSDTVYNNIAFGMDMPDKETVEASADLSTISREIKTFPKAWETEIGERGVTLSGGQKQRIAISRALAVNPEILVLDDALSAVDADTEARILRELNLLRRGKTNIIVSHRVSTLAKADQIVVLDQGRIVQRGTHVQLIETEGFYREIHLMQMMNEERDKQARREFR